jgi:hypothetical protein
LFLDLSSHASHDLVVNPSSRPEPTPDIQEILRKRREMLNRVKADLERVGKLQQEFRDTTTRPTTTPETDK